MPFFGIGMKTDLFQSCGHCWGFQICWHIECSTFTASSFRILNSSAGIPSPPLALFIVMLPKAHFISHSITSGSRWVITPSWLWSLERWLGIVFLAMQEKKAPLALEKEMATHSSVLAWKIPWAEEPCGLQSMGSQRIRHDWVTKLSICVNPETFNPYEIPIHNLESKGLA